MPKTLLRYAAAALISLSPVAAQEQTIRLFSPNFQNWVELGYELGGGGTARYEFPVTNTGLTGDCLKKGVFDRLKFEECTVGNFVSLTGDESISGIKTAVNEWIFQTGLQSNFLSDLTSGGIQISADFGSAVADITLTAEDNVNITPDDDLNLLPDEDGLFSAGLDLTLIGGVDTVLQAGDDIDLITGAGAGDTIRLSSGGGGIVLNAGTGDIVVNDLILVNSGGVDAPSTGINALSFSLEVSGSPSTVLSVSGSNTIANFNSYVAGGTTGSTFTCSGGNVIQNAVVKAGLIVGGTCVAN